MRNKYEIVKMKVKDMTKEEARVLIKWLGYPDAPAVSSAFVRDLYRKAELPIPEHLQQKQSLI
jgi:hypothetical protein